MAETGTAEQRIWTAVDLVERFGSMPLYRVRNEPMPGTGTEADLVVEIVNRDNTRQEMDRKLREYFNFGVELVWHIDSDERQARVFRSPEASTLITEDQALEGSPVLPGFSLSLKDFFHVGGSCD